MVFSSPLFLFAFLPAFLLIYFLIPKKGRNVWLLLASLFFYSWGEGKLVVVLLFSTLADYVIALAIARNSFIGLWKKPIEVLPQGTPHSRRQKVLLAGSICINILVLVIFKYADFGLENISRIADLFGWGNGIPLTLGIALPLGISFYTFQSMSYSIDVFRGQVRATHNIIEFASFVTMFPQLVAGPIVRYVDVAKSLVERTISSTLFVSGIRRFVIGLSKKVLIANTVSVPVDQIFSLPVDSLSTSLAWFGAIGYALQIYFDFSGYSDMAIGLGRMLGFRFLENFKFPYSAQSLRDFWRRWHISLSTWFRDYVYISLGGNRKGRARTFVNLIFVFFITGLWHGASWNFIIWGLFHGFFLSMERIRGGAWLTAVPRMFRHVYIVLVVLISWVFFRADTLSHAWEYLQSMAGLGSGTALPLSVFLTTPVIIAVIIGICASLPFSILIRAAADKVRRREYADISTWMIEIPYLMYIVTLLFVVILQLSSGTHNPFIYFRF